MFSCGLGNRPPELEGLARDSENYVAYSDPKAPGRVTVLDIGEITLTNDIDELKSSFLNSVGCTLTTFPESEEQKRQLSSQC